MWRHAQSHAYEALGRSAKRWHSANDACSAFCVLAWKRSWPDVPHRGHGHTSMACALPLRMFATGMIT